LIRESVGEDSPWMTWLLLIIVTLGNYSFWVVPRLATWITRHQQFEMPTARIAP
jgi:Trk-type K+ transport system membrane component